MTLAVVQVQPITYYYSKLSKSTDASKDFKEPARAKTTDVNACEGVEGLDSPDTKGEAGETAPGSSADATDGVEPMQVGDEASVAANDTTSLSTPVTITAPVARRGLGSRATASSGVRKKSTKSRLGALMGRRKPIRLGGAASAAATAGVTSSAYFPTISPPPSATPRPSTSPDLATSADEPAARAMEGVDTSDREPADTRRDSAGDVRDADGAAAAARASLFRAPAVSEAASLSLSSFVYSGVSTISVRTSEKNAAGKGTTAEYVADSASVLGHTERCGAGLDSIDDSCRGDSGRDCDGDGVGASDSASGVADVAASAFVASGRMAKPEPFRSTVSASAALNLSSLARFSYSKSRPSAVAEAGTTSAPSVLESQCARPAQAEEETVSQDDPPKLARREVRVGLARTRPTLLPLSRDSLAFAAETQPSESTIGAASADADMADAAKPAGTSAYVSADGVQV